MTLTMAASSEVRRRWSFKNDSDFSEHFFLDNQDEEEDDEKEDDMGQA